MTDLDRLLGATASVRREAIRRDAGEVRDQRFDVPIAMLLDLADALYPTSQEVDRLVERLHGERYDGLGSPVEGPRGEFGHRSVQGGCW